MRNKLSLIIFIIFIVIGNKVYAISDEFEFIINTVGIPKYNVYNEEINEYVYNNYNIFVYSSPNKIDARYQRFKENSKGKTYNNGKYGEYLYIGKSYSGSLISNVYFPADFMPESYPNNWQFIYDFNAIKSWNDSSKYLFIEQLEYMKQADMLFDKIDFINNSIDSYNLISYGLTANKLGLDKVKLEACSTWKTNGILTVKRRVGNQIRFAIFTTLPIAQNVKIQSYINVPNKNIINKDEDSTSIIINYGANIINLNEYTNKNHIKEIVSKLYINDIEAGNIKGNKKINVNKEIFKKYYRESDDENVIPISIKVKSYAYTYFSVDGLMIDEISKDVNLKIEKKEKNMIPVQIATLKKEDSKYFKIDLFKTNVTNDSNSEGIIENGKYLILKLNLKEDTKIYLNNKNTEYEVIFRSYEYDVIKIKIENIDCTISDYNYLRNKNKDYYKIENKDIGIRIKKPNSLKIISSNFNQEILIDTISNYYYNFNYYLYDVVNVDCLDKKVSLDKWD